MHLDWTTIVGSLIVTWPPVIAGFIINWHKTRNHVDKVAATQTRQITALTNQQTGQIQQIANQQTQVLLQDGQPPAG